MCNCNIVKMDLSDEGLQNLLVALNNIHMQMNVDEHVKLEIDFDNGKIKAHRYNYRDKHFEVEI